MAVTQSGCQDSRPHFPAPSRKPWRALFFAPTSPKDAWASCRVEMAWTLFASGFLLGLLLPGAYVLPVAPRAALLVRARPGPLSTPPSPCPLQGAEWSGWGEKTSPPSLGLPPLPGGGQGGSRGEGPRASLPPGQRTGSGSYPWRLGARGKRGVVGPGGLELVEDPLGLPSYARRGTCALPPHVALLQGGPPR